MGRKKTAVRTEQAAFEEGLDMVAPVSGQPCRIGTFLDTIL